MRLPTEGTDSSQADCPCASDVASDQVRRIIDECIRRRAAGDWLTDAEVLAAHPDPKLRVELEQALSHLRMVQLALAAADRRETTPVQRRPAPEAIGHRDDDRTSPNESLSQLRIRCPHCFTPSDEIPDTPWDEIACSTCGNGFRLAGTEAEGQLVPTSIGHFEMIEQIGVGGFGTVWKARDRELDRTVAIKVPRRGQLTPAEMEQFFREARAAAQLRHPHIISVHEVGFDHDTIFIVSDFIDGISLAERLARERVTADEAAELCEPMARALQHAHDAGVIHRDLKPGNILLDSGGRPYLTDFGLARRVARETTVTLDGQLVGTPAYMSPEQACGDAHAADHRSDVYALGVVLFELLTGDLPFRGDFHAMARQIIESEPPNPRSLNGTIPRDLSTICLKCLEKSPSRRYATAADLADDLSRYLRREPIIARSVGRVERVWRWCRRKPAMAGLVASLFLVINVGMAGIVWNWHKAEQARQEAATRAEENKQSLERLKTAITLVDDGHNHAAMLGWDDAAACFSKAIALRPDFAPALSARTRMYQNLGLWELAAADYRVWFELQEPEGSEDWFFNAVTQAYSNDEVSYRRLCRRMRDRFGGSTNSVALGDLVRTAGLLPNDVADSRELVQWAQDNVKLAPGNRAFLFQLATAHYRAGQFSESIRRCQEALNVKFDWPNTAAIYAVLAMAYHGLKDDAGARYAVERLEIAIDSDLQQRFQSGTSNWAGHKGAVGFYNSGDWLQSQVYRRQARLQLGLRLEPDGGELALRARALAALHRTAEAVAEYSAAVRLSPNNTQIQVELHRTIAFHHVQLGQFAQAAVEYHQARVLQPLDSDLWRFEATAHLGANSIPGYLQVCNDMATHFHGTTDSFVAYNMVDALSMSPNSLLDASWFEDIANLTTGNRGGTHIRGMAQYRTGHYELALTSLEAAVTLYRPMPVHLYFLAMCHHQLGHAHEARQCLADAQAWLDEADEGNRNSRLSLDTRVTWSRVGWQERIQTDHLRREAESLIHGRATGNHKVHQEHKGRES